MNRASVYVSSIGADCCAAAREYGVGIELAQFCTAERLDGGLPEGDGEVPVEACLAAADRFVLHGPFNELTPAAIDPLVLEVTKKRYRQAIARTQQMGLHKLVLHAGYLPLVYYPEWFVSRSIAFWQALVQEVPADLTVCLENVMEPDASLLLPIVQAVADSRLRICLDLGHANTMVSKQAPEDWLRACAPYLSHVHLHNNDGARDLHHALNDGVMDVAALVRLMDTLCPQVTCTLELMQCASSLAWMEKEQLLEL